MKKLLILVLASNFLGSLALAQSKFLCPLGYKDYPQYRVEVKSKNQIVVTSPNGKTEAIAVTHEGKSENEYMKSGGSTVLHKINSKRYMLTYEGKPVTLEPCAKSAEPVTAEQPAQQPPKKTKAKHQR